MGKAESDLSLSTVCLCSKIETLGLYVLSGLIWVCTVCLYSKIETLCLYGLRV